MTATLMRDEVLRFGPPNRYSFSVKAALRVCSKGLVAYLEWLKFSTSKPIPGMATPRRLVKAVLHIDWNLSVHSSTLQPIDPSPRAIKPPVLVSVVSGVDNMLRPCRQTLSQL